MESTKKPLTEQTRKLAAALLAGPVSAIGGILYSAKQNGFLMTMNDLRKGIAELDTHGIRVRRIDAGGTPTWDVIE